MTKAAMCRVLGPPTVVRVEDVPAPLVAAGQARVKVAAASVNYPDVLIVAGEYQMQPDLPFVPGSEFAGVVAEVGPEVDAVAVGDRVAGTTFVGAFAEEVVVGAGALTSLPDGVSFAVGAAFGVAHRTAYHVLRSVARVEAGDEVVVLGAGGGVGLAAVRLATLLDARVTAVASSAEKLDAARREGAVRLVNHREGDLRAALRELHPGGADVVIDPVGGDLSEAALRSLRWGGRFVTVGYASGSIPRIPLNLVLLKGVAVLGFQFIDFATHAADEMRRNEAELGDLLATGQAVPVIGRTFPLARVADALALVGDGQAVGKTIIEVADLG